MALRASLILGRRPTRDGRLDAVSEAKNHAAAVRGVARPGDRLLNPQVWGSWFEFALPDLPVAIDSRIELFPPGVWDDYDVIRSGGVRWIDRLNVWDPTVAVVPAREEGLLDRLTGIGWRVAFSDAEGSVLLAPDR